MINNNNNNNRCLTRILLIFSPRTCYDEPLHIYKYTKFRSAHAIQLIFHYSYNDFYS